MLCSYLENSAIDHSIGMHACAQLDLQIKCISMRSNRQGSNVNRDINPQTYCAREVYFNIFG
jgi:hypothetical protein